MASTKGKAKNADITAKRSLAAGSQMIYDMYIMKGGGDESNTN
jgi:hypothetical protein